MERYLERKAACRRRKRKQLPVVRSCPALSAQAFPVPMLLVLVLTLALALSGCGESSQTASELKTVKEYSDAQVKLIAVTEKNRYSKVYTDQIWQIPVDEEGTTFQEYLLGEVRVFLQELKTVNLLADEQKITLTGQEKDRLLELTEDYYDSLTEADLRYTGISQEEVYEFYLEYYRADKLVNELTKDVNLEISDSEAKVITVQEIRLDSNGEAQRIHTRVMEDGVDFNAVAKTFSKDDQVEKSVGRGERSREYEDAVFSMTAGEISPIIREEDSFYIVKCISDYDEEATLERKQKLALSRKNQAFRKIYDVYAAEHSVELKGKVWEKIDFSAAGDTATSDFFQWYEDYMGS